MEKFLLTYKRKMTQVYTEDGSVLPVTELVTGPCVITQVKTAESEKYAAVQVAFGVAKKKRTSKAMAGHFKDKGPFRFVKEFRVTDPSQFNVGDEIKPSVFEKDDMVDVIGTSKGHGFTGAMKRHGFHGAPASHGHDDPRAVGSIGSGFPQHVRKGLRMAGRWGGEKATVKKLYIVNVDEAANTILVSGAVPGAPGSLIQLVGRGDKKRAKIAQKAKNTAKR